MRTIFTTLALLLFLSSVYAQKHKLYIYNYMHNSYHIILDNNPYRLLFRDSVELFGYFDKVNENNFLFVTRDSIYVLTTDQVSGIDRYFKYHKTFAYSARITWGVINLLMGSITLITSIPLSFSDPGLGLMVGASGGLVSYYGYSFLNNTTYNRKLYNNAFKPSEFSLHSSLMIITAK